MLAEDLLIPPGVSFWKALQSGYLKSPWRSPEYLAFVASLPCVITGRKPVTVHHMVGHGMEGQGSRTPDYLSIPLAPELHLPGYPEGLHAIGHREWERRHDDQRIFVLQTVIEAVHRRLLRVA